ncbi:uncharacterized protein LAESUDRAFT_765456 [Laetiporus sulphureus 93-53]|uniref:DUF4219 domain-containing protein n=1 Tax=Laetiporus sulphureus 93-53 TaxID=1314785 RepID=A0A165AR79_9APHY|nr:uncharacterized protein LAESUDRAFT_765456 [Laetiporus sulphureus 93-53]KZS99503.1 hypothetical protein LAESUDRAFT_765456 [Laetiporus sulphureus 93-53]
MSDKPKDNVKVPQLVEGNYRLWAMKMQVALVQKDLWKQVKVEVEVKEGAKMAKAWAEIVLWVRLEQLELLEDEKDPHKCWSMLHDTHRAKGFTMELTKWWAFYHMQMQKSESGQGWIARMKGLVRALKEVDVEVEDAQKVLILVMRLTDKYEQVVAQVDNINTTERTFDGSV